MNEFQALILGLIQGLTEFLPISSSGHLEIGHALLGIKEQNNLLFAVVVHSATVLSTIIVLKKDIWELLKCGLQFRWNTRTKYILKLLISAFPVIILGIFFNKEVESLFSGQIIMVGYMLLVTGLFLVLTFFNRSGKREISFANAIVIGLAQALAVLPGISRSGITIAAGLLMGNRKEEMARFSFLMVLLPIIGALGYDILNGDLSEAAGTGFLPLAIGFITAFISGLIACTWMISIVKKGNLIYFAIYCFIIGVIAIFAA